MGGAGDADETAGFLQFAAFRKDPGRAIRCFLSHSLGDPAALDQVKAALPAHVEPVVFPALPEAPSDTLSKALLASIAGCDVLVYLRGGLSDTSLWMNFERRYARRRGLAVYGFDPSSSAVEAFTEEANNIIIPLLIHYQGEHDDARVHEVLQWLQSQRNVSPALVPLPREPHDRFDAQLWTKANTDMRRVGTEFHAGTGTDPSHNDQHGRFYRALQLGGTVVLFLSNAACEVAWPHADLYLWMLERDGGDASFDRPKIVWMEHPDVRRIEAAFERLGDRPDNVMFRAAVRKSIQSLLLREGEDTTRPLDRGTPLWRALLIERDGEIDWKQVDTLLIDLEFVAHRRRTRAPAARLEHHEQAKERERLKALALLLDPQAQKAVRPRKVISPDEF